MKKEINFSLGKIIRTVEVLFDDEARAINAHKF